MFVLAEGEVYFISDEPLSVAEILIGFAVVMALVFIVEKLTRKK